MEVHLSDLEKKMLRIHRHSATRLLMYERGQRESMYQESHDMSLVVGVLRSSTTKLKQKPVPLSWRPNDSK